jgi:hypothetical protein
VLPVQPLLHLSNIADCQSPIANFAAPPASN